MGILLTATFYGSQNGKGQYHKNSYTKKKLIAICKKLDFEVMEIKTLDGRKIEIT